MEHFFVKFLVIGCLGGLESDFLVGKEHQVVYEDFGGLLESVFGMDRAVCGNLKREFVVVGLLVNAEVVNGVLHILDGGVDGVDCEDIDGIVGRCIFLGGNPTAPFVDCELNVECCVRIQITYDKVGVEHFEVRECLAYVAGFEHLRP